MLQPIVELDRLVAPSPQPHAIAIDGATAYLVSRATERIDVLDLSTWKKTAELEPAGMAWGLTFGRKQLLATCSETEEDIRRIRTYVPGSGWLADFIPCPDQTGSHLAVYQGRILLGQWYNKLLLQLADDGNVLRRYEAPHGVAGVTVRGDEAYLLTTDDEDDGDYWITRYDLHTEVAEDVARVPFRARGLFWDGERFWTNFREADRVVTFALPL